MIRLTRLRQPDPFWLNPDHIERVEHRHESHVHLFNGTEYVVEEGPDVIVARIVEQRARIMAVAARLAGVAEATFDGPPQPEEDD